MNQKTKYITGIVLFVLVICALTIPAFALTESDVQSQVSASGKEGVAGNLFIWFLCAVAFLKISQKIDSFMRRGGNAGRAGSTGGGGGDSNTFLQGGLAGVANRSFYNGAYRNATGTGSGGAGSGDVVSSNMAADALKSYMGYTALGEGAADIPNFSNVEIGGGHITGTETSEEEPAGRAFAMYSTEQYMEPKREYTTVTTVDGAKWYRQYAQDVVEKKPYQNPDGGISYRESLIRRLPDPPRRKDKT